MKFKPQIDDFDIVLIDGLDTNIEKAIVEYDIPFADGAICDDMGVKSRTYQIKTLWHKDNYDRYEKFLDHAKDRGFNHFVHPELGLIVGRIKNITVTHDKRKKCAEIAIEFIEDCGVDASPTFAPALVSALEDAFEETLTALTESIEKELESSGIDTKRKWVNGVSKIGDFLKRVNAATLRATNQINAGMSAMNRAINSVLNPLESVVSLVVYAATLPGAILGAVARAVERAVLAFNNLKNAPALFMKSLKNGINSLKNQFKGMEKVVTIMGASIAAIEVGKILEADEEDRATARNIENAPQTSGIQHVPPLPQTFTADDLDVITAGMAEIFESAITAAREDDCPAAVFALKKSLRLVQNFIKDGRGGRDRIITVHIETPMPMHAVLLRYDLPHSYLDRVMSINNIRNPNFVQGDVRIYARRG